MVRTYVLVFDTDERAKRFVHRLHLAFDKDVSTYRDGFEVMVFDATPGGVQNRVSQLARSSSASMIRVKAPGS